MSSLKHSNVKEASNSVNSGIVATESFIEKNKKVLLIALLAIVVLVAGYFAYRQLIAIPKSDKASTLLGKGQEYFENNEYTKALNGDSIGYIGFIKIADKYSSTDAENLANLYAGLSYAQMGNAQEAVKYLEKFSVSSDQMISPAAIAALGNSYASAGQVDKGINKLKEAAKKADNNSLSPIFLLQAGELLESTGKKEEAKELYQEIKDKYFRSPIAQDIDKYIERASLK